VVVKADAGTYGMGVMTVKDAAELIGLNRKQRNKMSVVKEGLEVHDVIIQEGVHTFETLNGAVAEPVVMMDHYVVGGFYRVQRGRREPQRPGHALRAAGLRGPVQPARLQPGARRRPNRFYAYGVVARLALLAASVEIEETAPAVPRRPEPEPAMKFAFILDPLDKLKAYKDSSIAMMRAAARRGHESSPSSASADLGGRHRVGALPRPRPPTSTTPGTSPAPSDPAPHRLRRGADAPGPALRLRIRHRHLAAGARAQAGARIFNHPVDPRPLRKLAITEFPQFAPPTRVACRRRHQRLHRRPRRHHPQAPRRHGRQPDLPGAGRRPQPQRHHRDPHPGRARTIMAQAYLPAISAATSGC
jgi:hypothetical protein